jgi:hypothetical protein
MAWNAASNRPGSVWPNALVRLRQRVVLGQRCESHPEVALQEHVGAVGRDDIPVLGDQAVGCPMVRCATTWRTDGETHRHRVHTALISQECLLPAQTRPHRPRAGRSGACSSAHCANGCAYDAPIATAFVARNQWCPGPESNCFSSLLILLVLSLRP